MEKKKRKTWITYGIAVIVIGATVALVRAGVFKKKVPLKDYDLYTYPVEQVIAAEDHGEKIRLAQLPEAYLQKDTETLLANCLRYPLIADYAAYDSKKLGMDVMCKSFNGLTEFMKREDKETVLAGMDPEEVDFSDMLKAQKGVAGGFLKDLQLYLKGQLPGLP